MKKKIFLMMATVLLGLVSLSLNSCSSDDSSPSSGTKTVKYEVTGNYSGHLFVVFTGANGQNVEEIITTLPWSKEVAAPNSLIAVGFGGQTSAQNFGAAGQTARAKIYVNNVQKQTGTATADGNGAMTLPSLATHLE